MRNKASSKNVIEVVLNLDMLSMMPPISMMPRISILSGSQDICLASPTSAEQSMKKSNGVSAHFKVQQPTAGKLQRVS